MLSRLGYEFSSQDSGGRIQVKIYTCFLTPEICQLIWVLKFSTLPEKEKIMGTIDPKSQAIDILLRQLARLDESAEKYKMFPRASRRLSQGMGSIARSLAELCRTQRPMR